MSMDDTTNDMDTPMLQSSTPPRFRRDEDEGCLAGLCQEENRSYYINSCIYYFFRHAIDSVVINICCCCRCLESELLEEENYEPPNNPQKLFAFCIKQLSNWWASALLLFVVQWVFLRPADIKPMLGASMVNQFELLRSPAANGTDAHLRFNFTTHLLFSNSHYYYSVGYDHPAAAVYYAGEKIGPVDDAIPSFLQKATLSNVVEQVVVGRLHNASGAVAERFLREKAKGRFELVMRIRVKLTFKSWPFEGEYFTSYDCPLSTPVPKIGHPALSSPAYCDTIMSIRI